MKIPVNHAQKQFILKRWVSRHKIAALVYANLSSKPHNNKME